MNEWNNIFNKNCRHDKITQILVRLDVVFFIQFDTDWLDSEKTIIFNDIFNDILI